MEFTFWLAIWPATDEPAHLMSSILFQYVFYLSNTIYTDYVCVYVCMYAIHLQMRFYRTSLMIIR